MQFCPFNWLPRAILIGLCLIVPTEASVTYTATTTGVNNDRISASATFLLPGETDLFGHTCTNTIGYLCLSLENTTSGGTLSRADVLTAAYFSVTGNPTLTAVSATADTVLRPSASNVAVLSTSPQSTPLAGGWALAVPTGGSTTAGLPKTGYAWTTVGASGGFNAGTLNIGNDDYSIVATGTNLSKIGGGITVVQDNIFFVLSGFQNSGSTRPLSDLTNIVIAFNSTNQYFVTATTNQPEPATFGVIGVSLVGLAFRKRIRRLLSKL